MTPDERGLCPECGCNHTRLVASDTATLFYRDGHKVEYERRKYECQACGKRWLDQRPKDASD